VLCTFLPQVRHDRLVGADSAVRFMTHFVDMFDNQVINCRARLLQVRHDRRVGADSAIRFMTDGVLMRQLQSDFLLRSYSVILLDEAHERSLNTDLLLGECSKCDCVAGECWKV
jgi:hypothetical protein